MIVDPIVSVTIDLRPPSPYHTAVVGPCRFWSRIVTAGLTSEQERALLERQAVGLSHFVVSLTEAQTVAEACGRAMRIG